MRRWVGVVGRGMGVEFGAVVGGTDCDADVQLWMRRRRRRRGWERDDGGCGFGEKTAPFAFAFGAFGFAENGSEDLCMGALACGEGGTRWPDGGARGTRQRSFLFRRLAMVYGDW